ncbi:hypothetical protein [Pseudoalteromonas shioyasakiensis]|uniref:hypothetical protein n=1 Tax=Pseudoalteromonas shioyasakiensis TaxID=1190813 RepID=UPI0022B18689|nr:hypothetical protein [Pseudoalteromonas shioyasakiensis]MCZ4253434.1 hypothetical protein [Pseudoalteromonas shioyasakiensis]
MPAFTASQASVTNNSKVVQINSGESIANVNSGDFLVLAGFIIEINRAYLGGDGKGYFELVKNWPNSNQTNQECIVIPTTGEFKKAVDALTSANVLVNDNFKAMQDWQTKTGTVTFTNQEGTTTTVKTLKQIENEAQAQMDATHPHPWAIRKGVFESNRNTKRKRFAASSFISFGKHSGVDNVIGEGLQTYSSFTVAEQANSILLGRTTAESSLTAKSSTDSAILNFDGVEITIDMQESIQYHRTKINFPPPEEGTRTYDSDAATSLIHASPAIAFASETDTNKVVTDRVDLWGFEIFLREINENDPFVYDKGMLQSKASTINGVPATYNAIRPLSYFAWYIGDESVRGQGVNWLTASEESRAKIASDPSHNIFFDDETGKFYQWTVRGRTIAGLGNGDWASIDSAKGPSTAYPILKWDGLTKVRPQGVFDTVEEPSTPEGTGIYTSKNNGVSWGGDKEIKDRGIYQAWSSSGYKNTDYFASGYRNCYFVVCGTLPRLNLGGHHPRENPLGSRMWTKPGNTTAGVWCTSQFIGTQNKAMCFEVGSVGDGAPVAVGSGRIVSGLSGRADKRYADAVYASGVGGICRDMRYPAKGLQPKDFAEADLLNKASKLRGRERLPFTRNIVVSTISISRADKHFTISVTDNSASEFDWIDSTQAAFPTLAHGTIFVEGIAYTVLGASKSGSTDIILNTDRVVTSTQGESVTGCFGYYMNVSVAGVYTHTDVIGSPAKIKVCTELKDGWQGSWVPRVPDGAIDNFPLTKPFYGTGSSIERLTTLDDGATWNVESISLWNAVTNETGYTNLSASAVVVLSYQTKAKTTEPAVNTAIYAGVEGIGNVWFCNFGGGTAENGRLLTYSLIDKITTGSNSYAREANTALTRWAIASAQSLFPNAAPAILKHELPEFEASNSPTVKALNYLVNDMGQGYLHYAFAELVHNGTDWGDDGQIHITDNLSTMPDENGNTVLVGAARNVEPLGWLHNDK